MGITKGKGVGLGKGRDRGNKGRRSREGGKKGWSARLSDCVR